MFWSVLINLFLRREGMKFNKEERSWITYDWANSVYATTMLAAIFPIYFVATAGSEGDYWWGVGTSIATGIFAILAPIIGAIADYKGMKKKLFSAFLVLGIVFTGLCAVVDNWQLMLVGYIISHIGFSGSILLYDSFITDVTTEDRMDRVSAWGFGMGYIGGSTIPFIMSIALITFGESFGVDGTLAVKLSLLITVIWWAVFSIPFLRNCTQKHGSDIPAKHLVKNTFSELYKTFKSIVKNRGVILFILAYFFYIDGVNTVIGMSTAYGATLGLDSVGMILALLVTQLIAFPCAILFGRLAGKFGSVNLLTLSIGIYLIICATGFIMGFGIEENFLTIPQATAIFWALAVMVGLVQGGIQALSRSHFGKMIPKEKSSEYFGVFDIFGKFAAVIGPVLYASVRSATGRSSFAILAIVILFIIGGAIMIFGRKYIIGAKKV